MKRWEKMIIELEKDLKEIEEGRCLYGPCSSCRSGVDEHGEVYCDRLKRLKFEILYSDDTYYDEELTN